MGLPSINNESRFLVRYSKLFGIFLLKLAAEVESNMIRATFSGIPPGFVGRSRTSFLGNTCICTSDFVWPEDVSTSTRMKSWSTDAIPVKTSTRKNKMKMLAPASRSQSGRSIRRNAMFPISFPEPTCLSVNVSWCRPKDTWALGTRLEFLMFGNMIKQALSCLMYDI